MRHVIKVMILVFLVGQGFTSCTKAETISEEDQRYLQATEGSEEHEDEERGNG